MLRTIFEISLRPYLVLLSVCQVSHQPAWSSKQVSCGTRCWFRFFATSAQLCLMLCQTPRCGTRLDQTLGFPYLTVMSRRSFCCKIPASWR